MKAKLKFKGKEIIINDIEKAEGLKKIFGLMFKKKESNALVFKFNFPSQYSIHSYFCKPFLAIWLNKGKIIDHKIVGPNSVVSPLCEFDQLVEVPLNEKYKNVCDIFLK